MWTQLLYWGCFNLPNSQISEVQDAMCSHVPARCVASSIPETVEVVEICWLCNKSNRSHIHLNEVHFSTKPSSGSHRKSAVKKTLKSSFTHSTLLGSHPAHKRKITQKSRYLLPKKDLDLTLFLTIFFFTSSIIICQNNTQKIMHFNNLWC